MMMMVEAGDRVLRMILDYIFCFKGVYATYALFICFNYTSDCSQLHIMGL